VWVSRNAGAPCFLVGDVKSLYSRAPFKGKPGSQLSINKNCKLETDGFSRNSLTINWSEMRIQVFFQPLSDLYSYSWLVGMLLISYCITCKHLYIIVYYHHFHNSVVFLAFPPGHLGQSPNLHLPKLAFNKAVETLIGNMLVL